MGKISLKKEKAQIFEKLLKKLKVSHEITDSSKYPNSCVITSNVGNKELRALFDLTETRSNNRDAVPLLPLSIVTNSEWKRKYGSKTSYRIKTKDLPALLKDRGEKCPKGI